MDAGVREPTEVIEDEMALVEDVRRASHIEVPPAIFELIDAHLEPCATAVARYFEWPLEGREGVNLLRYEPGGFYKPHLDKADLPAWPPAARRAFTVVLFLESSREADPAGGFSGGVLRLFPGRPRRLSTSCRVAGCSWPFPPKRCTRCRPSRRSSRYGGRLVLVSRFRPRRAGASAPASQPLRRLKPALYADTKSALTAWSGWSTASPRSPRPARAVTSSRARARAARLDDVRRRSPGCLAHRALARPGRSSTGELFASVARMIVEPRRKKIERPSRLQRGLVPPPNETRTRLPSRRFA